jgi:hypothetical protein
VGNNARNNPFNKWKKQEEIGPYDLLDMYGRKLQPGDTVILKDTGPVQWRVGEIKPDLRPRPPGAPNHPMVIVTFAALSMPMCPGGRPVQEILKVRDLAEDQPQVADDAPREAQDEAPAAGPTLVIPE